MAPTLRDATSLWGGLLRITACLLAAAFFAACEPSEPSDNDPPEEPPPAAPGDDDDGSGDDGSGDDGSGDDGSGDDGSGDDGSGDDGSGDDGSGDDGSGDDGSGDDGSGDDGSGDDGDDGDGDDGDDGGVVGPDDPDFYATPAVVGTGLRTVNVPGGDARALREAFANAQAGDLIQLHSGIYNMAGGSNLNLTRSGTAQNWIAVRAAPGHSPTIDMAGAGAVKLSASYILFEGIEVIRGGGNNVHVAPNSQSITHIIVRDCRIRDLSWGPGAAIKVNRNNSQNAAVSYVYVEGCELSQAINNATLDVVGLTYGVARNNYIHTNDVGSHGLFFKGGSQHVLVEGNLVRNIRNNAAISIGGNTGEAVHHPDRRAWETIDQVVRNNIVADANSSIFEIRGALRARVYHNTAIVQTDFAIFRFGIGWNTTDNGGSRDVEIFNNLILSTANQPQYARSDTTIRDVTIGPQLWGGSFRNSPANAGLPIFPQTFDVVVERSRLDTVVETPSFAGLASRAEALQRYRLTSGSPAKGRGEPNAIAPFDITGAARSASNPSLGAFE